MRLIFFDSKLYPFILCSSKFYYVVGSSLEIMLRLLCSYLRWIPDGDIDIGGWSARPWWHWASAGTLLSKQASASQPGIGENNRFVSPLFDSRFASCVDLKIFTLES